MTADEFVARHENDRMELVDGVVVEMPMPTFTHGAVCMQFVLALGKYLETNDIGRGASADSFVKTKADAVRGADVFTTVKKDCPEARFPRDYWKCLLISSSKCVRQVIACRQ